MQIDYSKYELSVKEKYAFLTAGYLCCFVVTYLFYHSVVFSVFTSISSFLFIHPYEKWKVEKRRSLLITQFRDMLYSMSAYVAANIQMAQAIEGCLDNLESIYDKESPLVIELEYMVRNIKENKESDIRLLQDFAERSNCEDIENFVQVYMACTVTGGDMEKALKNTIEILMDKINIEREIKTLTAQKKFEGNIITAMPLLVIMFLNIFSPDYLSPLYATIWGKLLMTGALAALITAHWMMRKLTDIEV